jgi:threonine/homoserine/homoserine lactone efflux protein
MTSALAAASLSPVAAGFGLGIALAGAPGPVQAVILTETVGGGMGRGLRAQAGANVTFLLLIVSLALGLSVVAPSGIALRVLKIGGGGFLVWLGVDGFMAVARPSEAWEERRALPPLARGTLAVLLNPGVWIFLATAASSLVSTAAHAGGIESALLAALALTIGLALGDGAVVLLGGFGVRRVSEHVVLWVRRVLDVGLVALGLAFLIDGLLP